MSDRLEKVEQFLEKEANQRMLELEGLDLVRELVSEIRKVKEEVKSLSRKLLILEVQRVNDKQTPLPFVPAQTIFPNPYPPSLPWYTTTGIATRKGDDNEQDKPATT